MKEITGTIQGDMFVWMAEKESIVNDFKIRCFVFGYVPLKTNAIFYNEGFNGAHLKIPWYKKLQSEITTSGFAKVFEVRLIVPRTEDGMKYTIGFPALVKIVADGLYKDRFYKSLDPAVRLWVDLKLLFERASSSDELSRALAKIVRTRMTYKW